MPFRFDGASGGAQAYPTVFQNDNKMYNPGKVATKSTSTKTTKTTKSTGGGGGVANAAAVGAGIGAGGGGGFGGGFAAPVVDPNAWKTDSTYLAQLAALDKALKDYQAQQQDSQNRYNVDYTNHVRDLGIEKGQSLDNNNNDYAARGLFHSGLMVDATGKLIDAYSRRQSDMDTAKANYLAGLQTDFTNFQSEQDLTRQKAQQDAIARAAAGIVI